MSVDLSPIVHFKNDRQLSSLYDILHKVVSSPTKINPTIVANLPVLNSSIQGTLALVTDSSVNTIGQEVKGGGNYTVIVWHTGQTWKVLSS